VGLSQRPRPGFSRIETPASLCAADPSVVRLERAGIVGMIDRKSEVLGARCAGDRLVSSLAERGSFKSCGTRRCGSRAAGGQLSHPRSLKPLRSPCAAKSSLMARQRREQEPGPPRRKQGPLRFAVIRKGTTAPIASQRRSSRVAAVRGSERRRRTFAAAPKNHTRSFPRGASVPASSLPSRTAA